MDEEIENTEVKQRITEDINLLLHEEEEESISSLLKKYRQLHIIKNIIEKREEKIKLKTKAFLKEHNWRDYYDNESKCNMKFEVIKREDVDKEKLRLVLSPSQLNQVIKLISYERMLIVTPELKKVLSNNVKFIKKG